MSRKNTLRSFFLSVPLIFMSVSCQSNTKIELLNANIIENTKFKSATIDITIEEFNKLGFNLGDSVDVSFSNGYKLDDIPYFDGYYVKNGEPVLVSYPADKNPIITLNNIGIWDNAKLSENDKVSITLNTKEKYLPTQEALSQKYSLLREDYTSDEEFCNFRALKGGSLKENYLYRGASPVDNSRNRAKYTDQLLKKNNINYILDLADSSADIQAYFQEDDFSSDYTKCLYEKNNMSLLALGSGYQTDTYKKSLVNGLKDLSKKDGTYYIHCMEGKDRTGFVCTLLEALAGATYNEMCIDYMETYKNYYKITKEKDTKKYEAIVSLYFDSFIETLQVQNESTYIQGAKNYLLEGGMTSDEITSLINKITK